jgi:hypothetical protein
MAAMNRKITERHLSPQELFDLVLLSAIHWPGKTVPLEPSSAVEYRQRHYSGRLSIAELYHENSKLYPQLLPQLASSCTDTHAVRMEYVRRRSAVARASGTRDLHLHDSWRETLKTTGATAEQDLFYAIEIRVVASGCMAAYEPVSDRLELVKSLSGGEFDMLNRALSLPFAEMSPRDTECGWLLLVASFARNDVLFGPRGYRRTLMEAGRLAEIFIREAARRKLATRPIYEFVDRDVDHVIDADGVELGALVAFEMEGATIDPEG